MRGVLSRGQRLLLCFLSVAIELFGRLYRRLAWLHQLGRLFASTKMPPRLPVLPHIQALSPAVIRVMGLNPGAHTLQVRHCRLYRNEPG
jgi:hypothetical protein